jgi:hypothetical protein
MLGPFMVSIKHMKGGLPLTTPMPAEERRKFVRALLLFLGSIAAAFAVGFLLFPTANILSICGNSVYRDDGQRRGSHIQMRWMVFILVAALTAAAWIFLFPDVLLLSWGWSGYLGIPGWFGFFIPLVLLPFLTMALIRPLWRWARDSN